MSVSLSLSSAPNFWPETAGLVFLDDSVALQWKLLGGRRRN